MRERIALLYFSSIPRGKPCIRTDVRFCAAIVFIKKSIGIAAVATTEHTWRYVPEDGEKEVRGAQIDLLIDRDDNVINVCEMKWASGEYVIQKKEDIDIRNKVSALERETGTKKAIHVTMVTTYGVKRNMYYDEIQSEVVLDQLFD